MTAYRMLIAGCAAVGAIATHLVMYGFTPLDEVLQLGFDASCVAGAISGALLGHLLWVLARPGERLSRTTTLCIAWNVFVWVLFLLASPELSNSEFQRIDDERARRDANAGMDLMTHQPIVVAGRLHGTYGAMNAADRFLELTAGPAIDFANLLLVPSRYFGILPTRRESMRIAALGFVLSTAFWTAVGGWVTAWRRRRRRKTRDLTARDRASELT